MAEVRGRSSSVASTNRMLCIALLRPGSIATGCYGHMTGARRLLAGWPVSGLALPACLTACWPVSGSACQRVSLGRVQLFAGCSKGPRDGGPFAGRRAGAGLAAEVGVRHADGGHRVVAGQVDGVDIDGVDEVDAPTEAAHVLGDEG